jgi:hypothetical protein
MRRQSYRRQRSFGKDGFGAIESLFSVCTLQKVMALDGGPGSVDHWRED